MSGPVAGSGRHREGASEQSNANSSAAGSKQTRREESEQPGVSRPVAGSGRHREGASEQSNANSPAAGSKQREEKKVNSLV